MHNPGGETFYYNLLLPAAFIENPNIIQLFLSFGANPNVVYASRQIPLAIAAKEGRYETVRSLLAAGAYHTYKIKGIPADKTIQPIEFAIKNDHSDVVRLLKYAGAKVPYRRSYWDVAKEIAESAATAIIAVATIYVIAEGLKHSNYSTAYVLTSSSSGAGNKSTTYTSQSRSIKASSNGCRSDFDCPGVQNICLKKPVEPKGICVQQIPWDAKRDLLEQAGHRSDPLLEGTMNFDCPLGFRYDVIYRACVK